jgi:hypothetical protein
MIQAVAACYVIIFHVIALASFKPYKRFQHTLLALIVQTMMVRTGVFEVQRTTDLMFVLYKVAYLPRWDFVEGESGGVPNERVRSWHFRPERRRLPRVCAGVRVVLGRRHDGVRPTWRSPIPRHAPRANTKRRGPRADQFSRVRCG